jgi:hypothetical protein
MNSSRAMIDRVEVDVICTACGQLWTHWYMPPDQAPSDCILHRLCRCCERGDCGL